MRALKFQNGDTFPSGHPGAPDNPIRLKPVTVVGHKPKSFLDRVGQFINDEILLNKDNVRVKNYQRAEARNPNFSGDWDMVSNIAEGVNVMSGGFLNRLSPTQNIGLVIDTAQGDNVIQSWFGNSGVVPDNFHQNNPKTSMLINGILDYGIGSVAPKKFNIGKIDTQKELKPNWNRWGQESLVDVSTTPGLVYKIPQNGLRYQWQIPFYVRGKLIANRMPEHVPYNYEGTIKVGNRYYPKVSQQKVAQRSLSQEEWNTLQGRINSAKGWKASPNDASASSVDYNAMDYSPNHNVGVLDGRPVVFDAKLGQGVNPFEYIQRNFGFAVPTQRANTFVWGGVNGQLNQEAKPSEKD